MLKDIDQVLIRRHISFDEYIYFLTPVQLTEKNWIQAGPIPMSVPFLTLLHCNQILAILLRKMDH